MTHDAHAFWNGRYAATDDYIFGTAPAEFLQAQAGMIPPGARVLLPADGEGRNAVYLAQLGLALWPPISLKRGLPRREG
jgi:hypothetical protein